MTHEQMSAELIHAGYSVEPPVDPATCLHRDAVGTVGCGPNGWESDWTCRRCGHHGAFRTELTPEQRRVMTPQLRNAVGSA